MNQGQINDGVSTTAIAAVGQLLVPAIRYENGYARHYNERCSATAVSQGDRDAEFLLSAWHCLEDYRDLSKPLTFELSSGFRSPVRVVASGESMSNDWILLKLAKPAPDAVEIAENTSLEGTELVMAGYPRDHNAEDQGPVTVSCRQRGIEVEDFGSDCVLQKGASGGAVFNDEGQIVGVISRGDGESVSIFVPVSRFRDRLSPYLAPSE
ncbi:MAG: serine protease [Pseudomonadota bacterium]